MSKVVYLKTKNNEFYCATYVNGKINSCLSLPEKDVWDIPNLIASLLEEEYRIIFSDTKLNN